MTKDLESLPPQLFVFKGHIRKNFKTIQIINYVFKYYLFYFILILTVPYICKKQMEENDIFANFYIFSKQPLSSEHRREGRIQTDIFHYKFLYLLFGSYLQLTKFTPLPYIPKKNRLLKACQFAKNTLQQGLSD